jgi:hypothetical protein
MRYGIGALILLIGIIVLIKYIMRTSESKESCSVDNKVSPSEERPDDEVVESDGIEIDIKDQK